MYLSSYLLVIAKAARLGQKWAEFLCVYICVYSIYVCIYMLYIDNI